MKGLSKSNTRRSDDLRVFLQDIVIGIIYFQAVYNKFREGPLN